MLGLKGKDQTRTGVSQYRGEIYQMRILGVALLAAAAHGSSISTSAEFSLRYLICSGVQFGDCQTLDVSKSFSDPHLLDISYGAPPIVSGSLHGVASGSYGSVFAPANANTGVDHRPDHLVGMPSEVTATAQFDDVVHFLGGPGSGFIDALIHLQSFRRDGFASASFTVGGATAFTPITYGEALMHLIVPFSMDGTIAFSARALANAADFAPSDPGQGASNGFSLAELRSITLTNAAGDVIHPQYFTDSGAAYLGQTGFVPEPGTWPLVAGSTIVIAVLRRARRLKFVYAQLRERSLSGI